MVEITSLNTKVNLTKSELYMKDAEIENEYLRQFKSDLFDTVCENGTVIYFRCSTAVNGSVHILNGGEKGENKFIEEGGTYDNLDKLKDFYESLKSDLDEYDETEDKKYSQIHKHKFYGNNDRDEFQWILREKKKCKYCIDLCFTRFLKSPPKRILSYY